MNGIKIEEKNKIAKISGQNVLKSNSNVLRGINISHVLIVAKQFVLRIF